MDTSSVKAATGPVSIVKMSIEFISFIFILVQIRSSSSLYTDYNILALAEKDWKSCKHPGNIAHGKTIVWGDGLLLEYQCEEGYFAVGITHGACQPRIGKWTIDPPVCVASGCPRVFPPKHGVVNVDHNGGTATFTCRPKFYLVGSKVLYCEKGQWRGMFPFCAVSAKQKEENKIVLKADEDNPYFVNADETCLNYQIEPPRLPNAIIATSYVLSKARGRYIMIATYSCVAGYRLANKYSRKMYCQNSVWGAVVTPRCIQEDNPCNTANGGCQHICVSRRNTYSCVCKEGYTLGSNYQSCEDLDECAIENGGCEQECHNQVGSFFCSCGEGYTTDGKLCSDIDECQNKETNNCPGPCVNLPGSYQCNCSIRGYQSSSAPHFCEDIDECSEDNGGCDDVCVNRRGSYECRCEDPGYVLYEDKYSCVDFDECERYGTKLCKHGYCVNTVGAFRCVCDEGFEPGKDPKFCLDVNECKDNSGGCEEGCENTFGSFMCYCDQAGYTISEDGFNCIDVDECFEGFDDCEDRCINTEGSYRCECSQVGKVISADNITCTDCKTNQFYNTKNGQCVDCPVNSDIPPHQQSHIALSVSDCECLPGYEGGPAFGIPCTDIDECALGILECQHGCINLPGSAHCDCLVGFSAEDDGIICRDIDECWAESDQCNHTCINSDGSYTCECYGSGYRLLEDGHTCVDINECEEPDGYCSHDCKNTEGSVVCTCPEGFRLMEDNRTCVDIDECSSDKPVCDHVCDNTPGSFICSCNSIGYKLSYDKKTCLDINECMEGARLCEEKCINTEGSFTCQCNRRGYQRGPDGFSCIDVDECAKKNVTLCPQVCQNIPGSYRCRCDPGYQRRGSVCSACGKGYYRRTGDPRCQRCPQHSTTRRSGSKSPADCVCLPGYDGNPGRAVICEDIDECQEGRLNCSDHCVNTAGSAYCTCPNGYTLISDKKSCKDYNECNRRNGGCSQTCTNNEGSFVCSCGPGYKIRSDGTSCTDLNECEIDNFGCTDICYNVGGSAKCGCRRGYILSSDGKSCVDRDECSVNNGGCGDMCINTIGSHRCVCNMTGFQLYHLDKKQCVDINECYRDSPCEDHCENTYGSYKCVCRTLGFVVGEDSRSCVDFDECSLDSENACDMICVNLNGSYRCDCPAGYFKQRGKCTECAVGTYSNSSSPDTTCTHCPAKSRTAGRGSTHLHDCKCVPGFEGDPTADISCIDINECKSNISGCNHHCTNYAGGFSCSCERLYTLMADKKTCKKVLCPHLARVANGRVWPPSCEENSKRQLRFGTVCSYRCQRGYILEGKRYRTCLKNSTWSGSSVKCTLKSCPGLKPPPNGKIRPLSCLSDKVSYRQRCLYSCNEGFRLVGRQGTKCRSSQRWSVLRVPKCRPVKSCSGLTKPPNGKVQPLICLSNNVPFRQHCLYSCNAGFRLVGKQGTRCRAHHHWSNVHMPKCIPVKQINMKTTRRKNRG